MARCDPAGSRASSAVQMPTSRSAADTKDLSGKEG